MATNLKRTTIFLTPELHERLRRLAFEHRTSIAALMREATLEFLDNAEDAQEGLRETEDEASPWTWEELLPSPQERRTG